MGSGEGEEEKRGEREDNMYSMMEPRKGTEGGQEEDRRRWGGGSVEQEAK